MLFSIPYRRNLVSSLSCGLLALSALSVLSACADVDSEPALHSGAAALVGQCTLGDGYVVPSGSSVIVRPVRCPSDCNDYPNGTFPTPLFCLNGVLGESDPALTGGSVAPVVDASLYNGPSQCTALPNPYSTPKWGTNSTRKTCVRL